MKGEGLVSVIMPVYMAEAYVESAIRSVMAQTYSNVELLCIDDGSSDGSYQICQNLSREYANIKVFHHNENLGQEAARNTGFTAMAGVYFMFLDADDTLAPETVETLVNAMEESSADIAMCTYSRILDDREEHSLATIASGFYQVQEFSQHLLKDIPWDILSCIGTKLYRTEQIRRFGIAFDRKYKFNEDCAFFLCSLLHAETIYYLNEPFYKYLIRKSDSTMSSYRKNMFPTNVKTVELLGELWRKYSLFPAKKGLYYQKVYMVMLDSLLNEVKFAAKTSFIQAAKQVRTYHEFQETFTSVTKTDKLSMSHRTIMHLLNQGKYSLVYIMLKLRIRMK